MEVGNIIKGHVNELLGLNKDISKERLKICKQCPLYLEDYGGQCNTSNSAPSTSIVIMVGGVNLSATASIVVTGK